METLETKLPGVLRFRPFVHVDERGYFCESFRSEFFRRHLGVEFVQENESYSRQHVLRGLHHQTGVHAQGKLVRVLSGQIFFVAVDLRQELPTYAQHESFILSHEDRIALWVPRGIACGFLVQSTSALVTYKCDNVYAPNSEAGLR